MATPESNHRSSLDRFLGIFADVHSGEGLTALLLALNVFLILMAYYILKPVREALILGEGSAELKTYMSAGQVVVLAFVVPLYASWSRAARACASSTSSRRSSRLPGGLLLAGADAACRSPSSSSSGSASST